MPNYQEPVLRIGPVGANIYRVRRKLRITQKQLAAPEFSISYISAIERGRIRPSLKALDILARRLGVTSAELLAEVPDVLEPEDDPGYGERETAPSLTSLISQRRSIYPTPLALTWATLALDQHNPQLARELLDLVSPAALTAEQRLMRLALLGRVALKTGQPTDSETELEQTLQQDEVSGYGELVERCRFVLACLYEQQGKYLFASDTFAACVRAIEDGVVGDPLFAIDVYAALAEHHQRLDRREPAIDYYQRAIAQLDLILKPTPLADLSAHLSQDYLESAHASLADLYASRSLALYSLAAARQRITQAISNLGITLQETGDISGAEKQLRLAIDLSERLGSVQQGILARVALADLFLKRQEHQQAEHLALEAQALCHPDGEGAINDQTLYGQVLVTLGDIYRATDRLNEADTLFKQAIDILKREHADEQLGRAYFHYSELLNQLGKHAEGYELVKQAYLLGKRGTTTPSLPVRN